MVVVVLVVVVVVLVVVAVVVDIVVVGCVVGVLVSVVVVAVVAAAAAAAAVCRQHDLSDRRHRSLDETKTLVFLSILNLAGFSVWFRATLLRHSGSHKKAL